jgi:transcriptional regulator with GAF, ATPase, and Fis domain
MKRKKDFDSIMKAHEKDFESIKKKTTGEKISDEILREWSYFRTLLEITRSINTRRKFNELLELIVDSAITLTKAERGFLLLLHEDGTIEGEIFNKRS